MMLEKEVRTELTEHIIPFWKKLRDDTCGGYYGYMDFDLNIDRHADKGCILNSRILWFFSQAYLALGDPSLLDEAAHAYDFLRDHCMDAEHGGVFWSLRYNGTVADTTKHTYNQAFAVYALASYYEASGCMEALILAQKLFRIIETVCTDPDGYLEAFTREWKPEDNDKLSENGLLADKTMNTLLHVLEAYTQLYHAAPATEVSQALRRILAIFRTKVYNSAERRLEVFFDEKMNTISDLYSYGHDIEASWLLDRACEVLGDPALTAETNAFTAQIAESVFAQADADGAMNNECMNGVVDTTRVWWVQAEAMVGFYNRYQQTGNEKYRLLTEKLWSYIKTALIDTREGSEWFWDVDADGVPQSKKPIAEPWKCPYHNGRMCMEIMRRTKQ